MSRVYVVTRVITGCNRSGQQVDIFCGLDDVIRL